jgi:hypothetical protein
MLIKLGHSEIFLESVPACIATHAPFYSIARRLVDKTLANQIERSVYAGRTFEDLANEYTEVNRGEYYRKMLLVSAN